MRGEEMGCLVDFGELLLISGAAAFGGTLVATAFGVAIFFSRRSAPSFTFSCNASHADSHGGRDRASFAWGECMCPRHHQALVFEHSSGLRSRGKEDIIDEPCFSQTDLTRPLLKPSRKGDGEWSTSYANVASEIVEDLGTMAADGVDEPALLESFCFPKSFKPDPLDQTKRKGYLSWDDYFMSIAFLSAQRSKDPNRQVGACLVSQDQVIFGIGYNGFPRGCSDDDLPWSKMSADGDPLKTKYPYVCHAEVNAILNKNHASAAGQKLYVTMFPCNECAKIIIQAGIAEVIYYTSKQSSGKDGSCLDPAYAASWKLLAMAGMKVRQHQPAVSSIVLQFK